MLHDLSHGAAGLSFRPSSGISELGLTIQSVEPYTWQISTESAQSSLYLPYIKDKLSVDENEYELFDARRHTQWLTLEGIVCTVSQFSCSSWGTSEHVCISAIAIECWATAIVLVLNSFMYEACRPSG